MSVLVPGTPGTPPPPVVPPVPSGWARGTLWLGAALTGAQALSFVADSLGTPQPWAGRVGSLYATVTIAVFVVACVWLSRSRELATAVQPRATHARRPVWVWLGWIVPVVNLWFPLQVVRDIRAATGAVPDRSRSARGLGWWWCCWVVALLAENVSLNVDGQDVLRTQLDAVALVATVVGYALWVRVVRDLTARQEAVTRSR